MKLLAALQLPFLGYEFALGVRKVRRPAPLPSVPPAPTFETTLVELPGSETTARPGLAKCTPIARVIPLRRTA